jgi:hypothetical protein
VVEHFTGLHKAPGEILSTTKKEKKEIFRSSSEGSAHYSCIHSTNLLY